MRKHSSDLSKHYFYVLKYKKRKEYDYYASLTDGSVELGYDIFTNMIEKTKNEILDLYFKIKDNKSLSFEKLYKWYSKKYNKSRNEALSYFYGVFQKLPYGYSRYRTYNKLKDVNKLLREYIEDNNVSI